MTFEMKKLEQEIILRNIKLVEAFIRREYGDLLVDTEDMFQVCYIAMAEAVRAYDYKVAKFSSLAWVYMDHAVKHSFKDLTGFSWDNYWGKKKIEVLLSNTSMLLNRKASVGDLVYLGFLDVSEERANNYLNMATVHLVSDLFPSQEEYEERLIDEGYAYAKGEDEVIETTIYPDGDSGVRVEDEALFGDLKEKLGYALGVLNEREKLVLTLRFGLGGDEPKSLTEVGKVIKVSSERVRQIEAKALRKLRRRERTKKVRDYLDYDFQIKR